MNDLKTRILRFSATLWVSVVVVLVVPWGGPVHAENLTISSTQSTAKVVQKAHWAMLVGKWFGEIEIAGVGKQKWIIERYANDT